MLRIGRKLVAEKYSTFNERLDQALRCTPVGRRHRDILDRSKPLLLWTDSLWRWAPIYRKHHSMVGEWKHRFINGLSRKTSLLRSVMFEPRQDPHAAPTVAGLLEQNPAVPNDQCVHFDNLLRFGSRSPHGKRSRIFCAAKHLNR